MCAKDSMNIKEEESGGWCQKKWKLGKVFQDGKQLADSRERNHFQPTVPL